MKLKALKQQLNDLGKEWDNCDVILSKDAEGNGHSPLDYIDTDCIYIPDSTYSGDIVDTQWTAEEACREDDEWERMKKKKHCILLGPVN